VNYYKGLIALRKAHPAFRMNKPSTISANLNFLDAPADILAYELNGKAVKDSWSSIVVISNPNDSARKVSLPETGNWKIVVQGDTAGTTVLATLKGAGSISVAAHSTVVIYK
jgi:pullulanase